jgi:hypothetical protein
MIGADRRSAWNDDSKDVPAGTKTRMVREDAQKIFDLVVADKVLAYATSGFMTIDQFILLVDYCLKHAGRVMESRCKFFDLFRCGFGVFVLRVPQTSDKAASRDHFK